MKILSKGNSKRMTCGGSVSDPETRRLIWGEDLSGSFQGAGGVGGLLASTRFNANSQLSTINFYHYDGNGNVTELTDASGATVASYRYTAFGQPRSSSGPAAEANEYRFSTKPYDQVSQCYYYGYRFYDPEMGRWLNRDPIGERGGVNLYGFVGNDVVNWIDVLGRETVDFWLCTTCSEAAPTSDSKVCEVHDGVVLSRGGFNWDARCVCECAGVSDWDNKVRGCLHCAEEEGVDRDEAHDACYDIADAEFGELSGWLARFDIFLTCQKCRVSKE